MTPTAATTTAISRPRRQRRPHTRGRAEHRRCTCRSCLPSKSAWPRTRPTARRSPSAPVARRRRPRRTSRSARPTRTARRRSRSVGSSSPAHAGNPSTPADEADVRFQLSMTDVRTRPGLDDYAGDLRAQVTVRRTDKDAAIPATTVDFPFSFAAPCSATADTSIGASCGVTTSADALVPGTVASPRGRSGRSTASRSTTATTRRTLCSPRRACSFRKRRYPSDSRKPCRQLAYCGCQPSSAFARALDAPRSSVASIVV